MFVVASDQQQRKAMDSSDHRNSMPDNLEHSDKLTSDQIPEDNQMANDHNLPSLFSAIALDATEERRHQTLMEDSSATLSSSKRFEPHLCPTLEDEVFQFLPPARCFSHESGDFNLEDLISSNETKMLNQSNHRFDSGPPHLHTSKQGILGPPRRSSSNSQMSDSFAESSTSSFNSSITIESALDETNLLRKKIQQIHEDETSSAAMRQKYQGRFPPTIEAESNQSATTQAITSVYSKTEDELLPPVLRSWGVGSSLTLGSTLDDSSPSSFFNPHDELVISSPVGVVETRYSSAVRSSITLESALLDDSRLMTSSTGPGLNPGRSWGVGSSLTLGSTLDDSCPSFFGPHDASFQCSFARENTNGHAPPPPPDSMKGLRFLSDHSPSRPTLKQLVPCSEPVHLSSGGWHTVRKQRALSLPPSSLTSPTIPRRQPSALLLGADSSLTVSKSATSGQEIINLLPVGTITTNQRGSGLLRSSTHHTANSNLSASSIAVQTPCIPTGIASVPSKQSYGSYESS